MSYFDHGLWATIKTDLALYPLPLHAAAVVRRLLSGEEFEFPGTLAYEHAVIERLLGLSLVEDYEKFDKPWDDDREGAMGASYALKSIEARGLIGELFA